MVNGRCGRTRYWLCRPASDFAALAPLLRSAEDSVTLAAAVAAFCVAAFWLLALAIGFLVPGSAIDPVAGVVVDLLLAVPVYLGLRPALKVG